MDRPQKSLVRLALSIHRALVSPARPARHIELPTSAWRYATDLVRQIRRAELHRWLLAASKLRADLQYALATLQSRIMEMEPIPATAPARPYLARPTDIYEDLVSLEASFEATSHNLRSNYLSVTTEPVTLEGRYLGPFEVRLDLQRLTSERPYRVIALDPHPAGSKEGVTHPHVLDEVLCEGEGRTAIRQALIQGRILDFFQLVVNLLQTYNRESPFVELALWNGEDCGDCGDSVSAEYRFECERCEGTVCHDCQTTCGDCEGCFCTNCIGECANCHDAHCGRCLKSCAGCQCVVCSGCLIEERCPNCHETETLPTTGTEAETTCAPIHTDRLGEAAIPA
jgi:hypothetical protein